MKKRQCTVVRENITVEDVREIREKQCNVNEPISSHSTEKTALAKALKGSREYLKEQGYIKKN